jgi:hypothetical protein
MSRLLETLLTPAQRQQAQAADAGQQANPGWADMTMAERKTTSALMWRFGGKFVSALSEALECADPANAQRLADACPELVAKYGPRGKFRDTPTAQKRLA